MVEALIVLGGFGAVWGVTVLGATALLALRKRKKGA
jgi:hypothetical protein